MTTTDLGAFGYRELAMLAEIINAMITQGLPDGFEDTGVVPMMNTRSGYVFITNDDGQAAMMNGGRLEIYHVDYETGEEGFRDDLSPEARLRLSL